MKRSRPNLVHQHGFTLLEAMVAMIIFSVGLLGLGALQMASMGNTQSALYQSVAAQLAYGMADRIRANPVGRQTNQYDSLGKKPTGTLCSSGCSPSQVATRDDFEWVSDIENLLPAGQGTVLGDGSEFTITVMWDASRNGATGTNCNPAVKTDLKCLKLFVRP